MPRSVSKPTRPECRLEGPLVVGRAVIDSDRPQGGVRLRDLPSTSFQNIRCVPSEDEIGFMLDTGQLDDMALGLTVDVDGGRCRLALSH